MRTCLIDNYDSYTFNLFQLAARVYGVPPVVLPNDSPLLTAEYLDGFDAVLLSPGPGRVQNPRDVGRGLDALRATDVPVLGVCLGHQAIAHLCGADVAAAPEPRHGMLSRVSHTGTGLFAGLPRDFDVVRYHSHCVRSPVPEGLVVDAWAEDGVIMAVHDSRERWWGVQFHPESIGSRFGAELLGNFRALVRARAGGRDDTARTAGSAAAARPGTPVGSDRAGGAGDVPSAPGIEEFAREDWTLTVERLPVAVDAAWVFERICAGEPWAFWLDSSRVMPGYSRFSYLGFPGGGRGEVLRYRTAQRRVHVTVPGGPGDNARRRDSHRRARGTGSFPAESPGEQDARRCDTRDDSVPGTIFDVLSARLRARRLTAHPEVPFDLKGGYVGYLGYELKADCGSPTRCHSTVPDASCVAATRYVVVDHATDECWVVAAHPVAEPDDAAARVAATARVLRGTGSLRTAPRAPVLPAPGNPEDLLARSHAEYTEDVHSCLAALRAGESYEICLTNELTAPFEGDPFAAYLAQRAHNPAPYAALLKFGDLAVLSSSPERFLRVTADGRAESKPIKGTAERSADPDLDRAARAALRASPKTFAENLMIVDLVRNDLGRVCEIGSVSVPSLLAVESYESVHQLVSTVRGQLRPGVDAVQAARACFPGGSMTGAPKQRTMELIEGLERRARGVYSGALGYFGLDGAADLSIVIRTAVIHDGLLRVGAGGAVVLDSDPEAEYRETLVKLSAALPSAAPSPSPARGPQEETSVPRIDTETPFSVSIRGTDVVRRGAHSTER